MLSEYRIKEIIEDCKSKGFDIKVRDISFMLLSMHMPEDIAYKSVFYSDETNFEEYNSSSRVVFLKSYWRFNVTDELTSNVQETKGITYDENKAAMERLIRDLTDSINRDDYADEKSKITAQKTVADLRIKLSEKFNISDGNKEHVVQVEHKYNDVCKYCNHEISVPTKEELMKRYNLIEKQ